MANSDNNPSNDVLVQASRQSRHFLLYAFFFSIFVNLLMLTGPLFMLQVYDRVLGSRSEETLVALIILVLALYGLMWAFGLCPHKACCALWCPIPVSSGRQGLPGAVGKGPRSDA